jgi:hypothetical protein
VPARRIARSAPAKSLSARGGEGIHHQAGATARNVRDHRSTAVQFGDRAQIDRKRETDLLAFAQPQARSADEDAGGAQIDRPAQATLTIRQKNVDSRACAMPRV